MAVITPPFVQQGGSHPAATFREMLMVAAGSPAAAFSGGIQNTAGGGGHGVSFLTDFVVTQNGTPNMSVNVAAGAAFVRGTEALAQGVYAGFNDATVNLSIAAADPTNPRRDLVVLRVRDAFYSGASTDISLAVITGTPAASPADPTVPANSLVIARVNVAAAVTSILTANIQDLRTYANTLGGIQRCTNAFRPSGASLFEGLYIDESDTDKLWRYDGTTFTLPTNLAGGRMATASKTSQQVGITTVTDITGLSVTFTALSGRRYEISLECLLFSTAAADIAQVQITDSSNNVKSLAQVSCLNGFGLSARCSFDLTGVSGSQTYKVRLVRVGGTGTLIFDCGATYPAVLRANDVGV